MAMMRTVLLSFMLMAAPAVAQQDPSAEQVLGAIAGGALGSTIGSGDGRKAATVIGAIIGWRMGERVLHNNDKDRFLELRESDFRRYCRHEVPLRYNDKRNLREMWIEGCVRRLENQQRELEREAYLDGLAP